MAKAVFSIDGVPFEHIRVVSLVQTFEILDNDEAKRTMAGEMVRGIIGTYYNYKLKLKPEYTPEGMKEYNKLWEMCSDPRTKSHTLTVPHDIGDNVTHTTRTFQAYITSGSREMLKYDVNGVDYWKSGEFQFISMSPAIKS